MVVGGVKLIVLILSLQLAQLMEVSIQPYLPEFMRWYSPSYHASRCLHHHHRETPQKPELQGKKLRMKKERLVTQIVMGPVGDAIVPLNPLTSAPVPVTLNYQTSQIQYNVTLLNITELITELYL